MEVLFISHNPHFTKLSFAESIGARIKITPFRKLVDLRKKICLLSYLYPFLCLFYGFTMKVKEKIILIEGGSSLWVGIGIKIKFPEIKMVYLDSDPCIIDSERADERAKAKWLFAFKKIDYIISASEMNGEFAEKYLGMPARVCNDYPKQVSKINTERKNYGLFVGRLDPDKNVKRIADFAAQCPYLEKFMFVGDGILKKELEDTNKNNKKILFLGQKKQVSEYYSQSKFLIHLPDHDAFPCATMEAALCGCFPIVSKGAGTSRLFNKIFVVENPDDFNSMNKKIKFILENENLAKKLLGEAVKKIPTKESAIKNFQKIFREITKEITKNENSSIP